MKQFISFVQKEFYHIFRDKRTMLILLVMPIIQILLFGFAITTELRNVEVAVFDPSRDNATEQIKEHIEQSKYFHISKEIKSPENINDIFQEGKINLVIVFSDNFANNMRRGEGAGIQLVTDGTEPNQASMITNYANGIISSYLQEVNPQFGGGYRIVPEVKMLYNPQGKSSYNFVPGVMGMVLILICAMMTSISIVREKENGTMEVLLASPINPFMIIAAKVVPYFTLSVVNLLSIILLSIFVLGVPISGSLALLTIVSMLFILVALSLGLLISTLVKTQMAAMLVSGMVLMMPIMILSGLMFPIESMPTILQYISAIIPARWYISAVRKIMIQGVEMQYVLKEIAVLLFMAAGLIFMSLKKFKIRLQ